MYRKEILHDLKIQFIDLLLVRWIFGRKIGHKNYEDFEHPTLRGVPLSTFDTPSLLFVLYYLSVVKIPKYSKAFHKLLYESPSIPNCCALK